MKLHNTRDEDIILEGVLARYRERFDEGAEVVTLRSHSYSTQSAMKTLVSPCFAALRLEQKTIFLPSGEKRIGDYKFGFKYVPKPAKPCDADQERLHLRADRRRKAHEIPGKHSRALTKFFWHLIKSEHVRLVQYRARKQAADL